MTSHTMESFLPSETPSESSSDGIISFLQPDLIIAESKFLGSCQSDVTYSPAPQTSFKDVPECSKPTSVSDKITQLATQGKKRLPKENCCQCGII